MDEPLFEQFDFDHRYLALAEHVSSWSPDPSTKTGTIIVSPEGLHGRVLSMGWNKLPHGLVHKHERLHDRELKYKLMIHSERKALLDAREALYGTIMYVWPFMPCSTCAGLIVEAGIVRVVAPHLKMTDPERQARWETDMKLAEEVFREGSVQLDLIETERFLHDQVCSSHC